jgi:hypothetical protein
MGTGTLWASLKNVCVSAQYYILGKLGVRRRNGRRSCESIDNLYRTIEDFWTARFEREESKLLTGNDR